MYYCSYILKLSTTAIFNYWRVCRKIWWALNCLAKEWLHPLAEIFIHAILHSPMAWWSSNSAARIRKFCCTGRGPCEFCTGRREKILELKLPTRFTLPEKKPSGMWLSDHGYPHWWFWKGARFWKFQIVGQDTNMNYGHAFFVENR